MDFLKEAHKLLERCDEMEIASVDLQGYPRVCVVSKLKSKGIDVIYFATGASGTKANHFNQNPKASVCFHDRNDSVTLVGEVAIVKDVEEKKSVWKDWLINHFKDGVLDDEFCLLKFEASEATFWIKRNFATQSL